MSDAELLDHLNDRSPDDRVAQLREENRELRHELDRLRDELLETKKTMFAELNTIQEKLNGSDPSDPRAHSFYESLTPLEKYARMPEGERSDLLSSSRQRAVLIFEHWEEWAQKHRAGWMITTKQSRDRKHGKSDIKSDLKAATGDDLRSVEVYRAMKMVAKLSAKDPDEEIECETDEYNREHVVGGAFEYHDKVNSDTRRKFKILKLVDEEAITLP